jgi:hypothetical protein
MSVDLVPIWCVIDQQLVFLPGKKYCIAGQNRAGKRYVPTTIEPDGSRSFAMPTD